MIAISATAPVLTYAPSIKGDEVRPLAGLMGVTLLVMLPRQVIGAVEDITNGIAMPWTFGRGLSIGLQVLHPVIVALVCAVALLVAMGVRRARPMLAWAAMGFAGYLLALFVVNYSEGLGNL